MTDSYIMQNVSTDPSFKKKKNLVLLLILSNLHNLLLKVPLIESMLQLFLKIGWSMETIHIV